MLLQDGLRMSVWDPGYLSRAKGAKLVVDNFLRELRLIKKKMVYGVWYMVYGVWCKMHGAWCMVYGVWCMVYGVWCMVHCVWCMLYGVWCMVYCVAFRLYLQGKTGSRAGFTAYGPGCRM